MFVPRAASSLRNSRRRQRTSSGESVQQPKAKRQRSIQDNIEVPLGNDQIERDSRHESLELRTPGPTDETRTEGTVKEGPPKHIAIRGPKKLDKREDGNGSDGTVVLVRFPASSYLPKSQLSTDNLHKKSRTNFYTVSQLPALPDQIRGLPGKFAPPDRTLYC